MTTNVNGLIYNEISFLGDEINRLGFELTRDRHSTPGVKRHDSRGQLANHMPRQNAITRLDEYQTAIQSEWANRLADHGIWHVREIWQTEIIMDKK